jgi:hypothetical protein
MIGRAGPMRHSGLGIGAPDWRLDSNCQLIDCSLFKNLTSSACWGWSQCTQPVAPTDVAPLAPGQAADTVDCTQFWNALTDSNCSFWDYFKSGMFTPVLLVAGALALLVVVRR